MTKQNHILNMNEPTTAFVGENMNPKSVLIFASFSLALFASKRTQ